MPSPHFSFLLEDEMLPNLRASGVTGIFEKKSKTVLVSEKVQIGVTIPDLIFALSPSINPIKSSKTRLTHFECAVLSEIVKSGNLTLQHLCVGLYASVDSLRHALEKLIRRGVVKVTGEQIKAVKSRLPKVKIIAVEAKLTRWRQALDQAVEYLQFSNSAYVAMPDQILLRSPIITASCKQAGVGLLSVGKTSVRIVVKAKSQKIISGKWLWTVDRMLS